MTDHSPDFTGKRPEAAFERIWEERRKDTAEQKESIRRTHLLVHAPLVDRVAALIRPGMTVVEVGAGTGYVVAELARRFPEATFIATDYADQALELLREEIGRLPNLKIERQDVRALTYADASVDLIFSQGLLEHFQELRPLLVEEWRAIRPGGFLVVDVPQKWNPYTIYKYRRIKEGVWRFGWETAYSVFELKSHMSALPGAEITDQAGYGYCFKEDYGFSWLRLLGYRFEEQKRWPALRPLLRPIGKAMDAAYKAVETRYGEYFMANVVVIARKKSG